MKQEATDKVVAALRRVLEGGIYLSDRMSERLLAPVSEGSVPGGVASLTDRELEVFHLIGQGCGTREIAEQLSLSVKTVETHRANIKQKLNIRNAPQLVQQAVRWLGAAGIRTEP
jgi:DNA-binding NarL/FixJ family response regulator